MSETSISEEGKYWYNVSTGSIEKGPQSDWTKLLGPYDTEEEARNAMSKVQARNEAWDAEDEEEA